MDRKQIIKLAKKDFEKAWAESGKSLKPTHHDKEYPRLKFTVGESHVLFDTINELREAYIRLGFNETINPLFIEKDDVYKQFGPEAPAVLDRCFYLAGLPRPDIGIGMDKIAKIEKICQVNEEKIENLQNVFRSYKKGALDGDDLVLEVSIALNVKNETGLKVLEDVFPEIHDLKPIANNTTLRSHMTSGWFITLSEAYDKYKLPLKLFSIDRCFRREQKEDASHLMSYHSASCVYVDDEISLDTGKAISESLLEHFGFTKFKFVPDDKKSKYYIPGTQTEVYAYHPKLKDWVEIATFGLYSPIALDKYGIDKEVMNLGVGVERVAMVLNEFEDIRKMTFQYLNGDWKLSDRELATMIKMNYYPVTEDGQELMRKIIATWRENKDTPSPCEFTAHKGHFLSDNIEVTLIEEEKNTNLLGPAATNELYVYKQNILGIPVNYEEDDNIKEASEKGIPLNISYLEALAAEASYKIEEMLMSNTDEIKIRSTIARSPSDVNLKIDDTAMNFINSNNKIIDIRGPIFSTIIVKRI